MKLKSLLLSLLSILAVTNINAQDVIKMQHPIANEASNQQPHIELSYCNDMHTTIGWNYIEVRLIAAIQIPEEIASKYIGAELSEIQVGIGGATGKDAEVFVATDIEYTDDIYTQAVSFSPNKWNNITLDEPYIIDGSEFFIGYRLTVGSSTTKDYALAVDNGPANAYGDWYGTYVEDEERWELAHLSDANLGNACIRGIISGDNLPKYDISLDRIDHRPYVMPNKEFKLEGIIHNYGCETISNFDVTYTIGDQKQIVTVETTDGIKGGKTGTFIIDNAIIDADGTYDVDVTISNPNGNEDIDATNNSAKSSIICRSDMFQRNVLLEQFSTTQCGNCPAAHKLLGSLVNENVVWVIHHVGYGTDTYTASASRSYVNFYNNGDFQYAPAMMLDRTNLASEGAQTQTADGKTDATGPVFMISSSILVEELINKRIEEPAFVELSIEPAFNDETRDLSVRVHGKSVATFESTPYINIFLTESGMVNYQEGGGNNYVHNHALRTTLTSKWGDELTINDDGTFDITYKLNGLKSSWKPENMDVVAFISNYGGDDYNNYEVYNSATTKMYAAGVNNIVNDECKVWSIGNTLYIDGNYNQANIYSLDGKLIKTLSGQSFTNITSKGIYIVYIDGKTHKVVI